MAKESTDRHQRLIVPDSCASLATDAGPRSFAISTSPGDVADSRAIDQAAAVAETAEGNFFRHVSPVTPEEREAIRRSWTVRINAPDTGSNEDAEHGWHPRLTFLRDLSRGTSVQNSAHAQDADGNNDESPMRLVSRRFLSHYMFFYVTYLLFVIMAGTCALHFNTDGLGFNDSLYLSVSVVSMTGLSPVDFASQSRFVHAVSLGLCVLGSPILLSIVPVVLRRWALRRSPRAAQGRIYRQAFCRSIPQLGPEDIAMTTIINIVLIYWTTSLAVGWLLLWMLMVVGDFDGGAFDAMFTAISAFHNGGLTTMASLPFQNNQVSVWFLAVIMLLILFGNTCFPLILRFLVWMRKSYAKTEEERYALRMLLRHPRTCYTHLFPAYAVWWLTFATPGLVVLQAVALCLSDFWAGPANTHSGQSRIMEGLTFGDSLLATIFQSISTRTCGYSLLDLSLLSPTSSFVMMVCMWISTAPVVVVMRSTDLGHSQARGELPRIKRQARAIPTQLRAFMSHSLPALLFLLYVILLAEQYVSTVQSVEQNLMHTLFEFCSAWGTVGLSMSSSAASFSSNWTDVSKLSLCIVMFLGRVRGLPSSIDPSVDFSVLFAQPSRLRAESW